MRRWIATAGAVVACWLVGVPAAQAAIFTVNVSGDGSGPSCDAISCTLRNAVAAANANTGPDQIFFNLPVGSTTISLTSPLPSLAGELTIDGTTQPGYASGNRVVVDGSNAGAENNGFVLNSAGNVIKGLVINGFTYRNVLIVQGGNSLSASFVGANASGTAQVGTPAFGSVGVQGGGSGNTIGGAAAADGNVIAGGLSISLAASSGTIVRNNKIGVDATGTVALGSAALSVDQATNTQISDNVVASIQVQSASGTDIRRNRIGTNSSGTAALVGALSANGVQLSLAPNTTVGGSGDGNVISGKTGDGIRIQQSTGVIVKGNRIGTGVDGVTPIPNSGDGILIIGTSPSPGATVGGIAAGEGNTLANNAGAGVAVLSSAPTGIVIRGNAIYGNGGLGIDLGSNGFTPNDGAGDPDSGPNGLQNFPVVTDAVQSGGGVSVDVSLQSTPSTTFSVDVYIGSPGCDARTWIGTTDITTSSDGFAQRLDLTYASGAGAPQAVLATATGPEGTSELSACTPIAGSGSGQLSGGKVLSPNAPNTEGVVDLTAPGTDDWAVWGTGSSTLLTPDVRKAGGSGIGVLTDIAPTPTPRRGLGQFTPASTPDSATHPFTFAWTDGAPIATATAVRTGLQHNGQPSTGTVGDGFSFTVPADTTTRTLKVWVALNRAQGQFTATLSDGSAAAFSDSYGGVVDFLGAAYSLTYAAASAGQTLTVRWTETANACSFAGNCDNVSIHAAALSGGGAGPPPLAAVTLATTQASVPSTGRVPLASIPGSAFVARLAGAPESTPIKDIPIKDIPIKDIPIKDIPIKDIGFGDTAILPLLGQFPLSEVPLLRTGGWPTALQNTSFASAPLQNVSLGDALGLPGVQALNLALADLDLTRTPLGELPALATVLGTVPLGSLPGIDWCGALAGPPVSCSGSNPLPPTSSVLSVAIQGAPIKDIAITGIPIKDIPIKDIPIKDIPIKDIPIKDIPIKDIALSAIPIKDIAGYLTLVDCNRVDCVNGTLFAAFTAGPPAFPAATTIEDLVLALPEPNTVTLADLLVLLFSGSGTIGWEQLNLATAGLQIAAGSANAIDAKATVQIQPNPGPAGVAATVAAGVTLPAGFVWDPSAPPTATQTAPVSGTAVPLGDPVVGTDALGRTTLGWTLLGVVGRTYRLDFRVLPALRLGPQGSTASAQPNGGVKAISTPATVTVTDPFPSNGSLGAAALASPDSLYVSYVTSANDLDFFKIANPTAGSRIIVHLSHLPADYDLALYAPAGTPVRSALGDPLDGDPLTDEGVPLSNENAALSSQALDDLRIDPTAPLVGISANRGLEDDTVAAIASGTGDYTLQVTPYNGASSNEPYVIRIEIIPPVQPLVANALPSISPASASAPTLATGTNTLFLVNRGALDAQLAGSAAGVVQSIVNTQQALRANGYESAIVSLDAYPAVTGAMATFRADPGNARKANTVVQAINGVVDGLRQQANGSGIRYLVLVGGDRVIPFARLDDYTTISNEQDYSQVLGQGELFATFGAGFMLSDDPYGDTTPSVYLNRRLYVPDLAVGRLVETPAQIQAALARYALFAGKLSPTATAAGYDFLTDGARAVASELGAATTSPLLTDTWTREDLRNALAAPTDILSINAHADHTRFQPPGPASAASRPPALSTTDIVDGTPTLTNRLLFSMGCHAGLSVADAMIASNLDWPQAAAAEGAGAFAGNTTFGYGDTLSVAYSEEINRLFAQKVAAGLNVGDAWRFAKNEYFSTRGVFGVYDEKAMAAYTLYGLPMWSIRGPVGPTPAALTTPGPTTLSVNTALAAAAIPTTTTGFDTSVGLAVERFDAAPANAEVSPQPSGGRVWRGDSGFQISHLRPIQPKLVIPLAGKTGRNTLITGLTSSDIPGVNPVFARPVVDSTAAEPELAFNDVAFPAKLPSVRTYLTPTGVNQNLVLVTGQFFGNPDSVDAVGLGTQRLFSRIAGQVYGSTSVDVTPPAFQRVDAQLVNGFAAFSVDVRDNTANGVKRVLVLYRSGSDAIWKALDLAPGAGGVWSGASSNGAAARFEYFVQAADGGGNVAVSTNKGFYYDGLQLPATPPPASGVGDVTLDPPAPPAGQGGFFRGAVTVGVNAPAGIVVRVSIDGSAPTVASGSVNVTGDGVHVLQAVGSNGDTDTKVVAIDGTPPNVVFSTPSQGATYEPGSTQPADYACVDPGSGVDTGGCAGTVVVGQPIATSPPGTKVFSINVRDRAGNVAIRSVSYSVAYRPILFSSTRTGLGDIYSVRPDATGLTRITNNLAPDVEPAWSPDGRKIAFASRRSALTLDVFVMNADGSNVVRLTTAAGDDSAPAWSPDGGRIAFESNRDGNAEIYVMNANGSSQQRLTNFSRADTGPTWSPDGGKLAFTRATATGWEIYSMTTTGATVTRLTTDGRDPNWGPTGKIVFTRSLVGAFVWEVFVMNGNGEGVTRLTNVSGPDYDPAWARDGQRIVFASGRNGVLNLELYTMAPDGTGQTRITTDPSVDRMPDW